MSIKHLLLIPALAVSLTACVEVRDKEDAETKAVVLTKNAKSWGNITIDETLYLFDGRFLTEAAYKAETKHVSEIKTQTFEFNIDRLTLTHRGQLYTMGHTLRMSVRDLQSSGGVIATFPNGQEAVQGRNGRGGGDVVIEVQQAVGVLHLVARGEKGGFGFKGKDPDFKLHGRNVRSGSSHGAKLNPTGGSRGYPGQKGAKGGHSGIFYFAAQAASNFTYQFKAEAGAGGERGPGGDGGRGGLKNNRRDRMPDGPEGNPGPFGDAGTKQTSCFEIESEMNCL